MESGMRAGISTFIMHGKEYLAAILAENGILMMETLRYRDELRLPGMIGLPEAGTPDGEKEKTYARIISELKKKHTAGDEFEDRYAKRFREFLDGKEKSGKGIINVQEKGEPEEEEGGKVIDFVAIFKERFAAKEKQKKEKRTA
jgi:DNA end-binding protein Ku